MIYRKNQIKAVIFDMDDTLYPEKQFVLSGFRAVSGWVEENLGFSSSQTYSQLESIFQEDSQGKIFNHFLAMKNVSDEAFLTTMVECYRSHYPNLEPYPEVRNLLEELSSLYHIGLISDGYLETQNNKWQALGLQKYFDTVVFSDQWGKKFWKPHKRPYLEALRRLEIEGIEAVYVGDNPNKDFFGANQLGIYTIMVVRKQGVYARAMPPAPAYQPAMSISDLRQLPTILQSI